MPAAATAMRPRPRTPTQRVSDEQEAHQQRQVGPRDGGEVGQSRGLHVLDQARGPWRRRRPTTSAGTRARWSAGRPWTDARSEARTRSAARHHRSGPASTSGAPRTASTPASGSVVRRGEPSRGAQRGSQPHVPPRPGTHDEDRRPHVEGRSPGRSTRSTRARKRTCSLEAPGDGPWVGEDREVDGDLRPLRRQPGDGVAADAFGTQQADRGDRDQDHERRSQGPRVRVRAPRVQEDAPSSAASARIAPATASPRAPYAAGTRAATSPPLHAAAPSRSIRRSGPGGTGTSSELDGGPQSVTSGASRASVASPIPSTSSSSSTEVNAPCCVAPAQDRLGGDRPDVRERLQQHLVGAVERHQPARWHPARGRYAGRPGSDARRRRHAHQDLLAVDEDPGQVETASGRPRPARRRRPRGRRRRGCRRASTAMPGRRTLPATSTTTSTPAVSATPSARGGPPAVGCLRRSADR